MSLAEEERQARLESTRDIAWNMLDDLRHVREVLAKHTPTSGDLRRLSNILRRLLIDGDGDLRRISPPRLSRRLLLLAPNMTGMAERYAAITPQIASLGMSGIFGLDASQFEIMTSPPSDADDPSQVRLEGVESEGYLTADGTLIWEMPPVAVTQSKFLSQQVLWCWNKWVRRGEIIKYIANVAGGVHSGTHASAVEDLLMKVRNVGTFRRAGTAAVFSLHLRAVLTGERPDDLNRDGIDLVLLQIMAAARYLAMSPDIRELERLIAEEIR